MSWSFSQTRVRLMPELIFPSWGCQRAGRGIRILSPIFRLFKDTCSSQLKQHISHQCHIQWLLSQALFGWSNESGLGGMWRCLAPTAGSSNWRIKVTSAPHSSQLQHFLESHIHKSGPRILTGSPPVLKVKGTFPFNCFDTMWPFSSTAFQAHPLPAGIMVQPLTDIPRNVLALSPCTETTHI